METVKFMQVGIRTNEDFPLPEYSTSGSAGIDLRAHLAEDITIKSGATQLIGTGLAIELPNHSLAAFVYARSGLGGKRGIVPSNCVGVIDSDYRGEIIVALYNHGNEDFVVHNKDRIAQLVISPIIRVAFEKVESLEDTSRGTGGFGSTGIK